MYGVDDGCSFDLAGRRVRQSRMILPCSTGENAQLRYSFHIARASNSSRAFAGSASTNHSAWMSCQTCQRGLCSVSWEPYHTQIYMIRIFMIYTYINSRYPSIIHCAPGCGIGRPQLLLSGCNGQDNLYDFGEPELHHAGAVRSAIYRRVEESLRHIGG